MCFRSPLKGKNTYGHVPARKRSFHAVACALVCTRRHRSTTAATPPRLRLRLFATSVFELFFFFFFFVFFFDAVVVVVGCFSREEKPLYPKATTRTPARGAVVVVVELFGGRCCCCRFREPREGETVMDGRRHSVFGVLARELRSSSSPQPRCLPAVPSNGGDVLVPTVGSIVNSVNGKLLKRVLRSLSTKRGEKKSAPVCRPPHATSLKLFELSARADWSLCSKADKLGWRRDGRAARNRCSFPSAHFCCRC